MQINELQSKPSELDDLRAKIADRNDSSKVAKYGVGSGEKMQIVVNGIMAKYGFSPLGTGAKGTVYGKVGYSFVLKVFGDDSAYLAWLGFCRNHQHNPYVPKIKGKPIHILDQFYAIRLERLLRPSYAYDMSEAFAALSDKYVQIYEHGMPLEEVFNSNGRYNPVKYIRDQLPNYASDKHLIEVLKGIHELKESGFRLDIHNDNIMSRGFKGHPVVIDAIRDR